LSVYPCSALKGGVNPNNSAFQGGAYQIRDSAWALALTAFFFLYSGLKPLSSAYTYSALKGGVNPNNSAF